jgi:GTP-binding protein
MDLPDVQERWPAIKQALEARGAEVMPISAATHDNLMPLLWKAHELLQNAPEPEVEQALPVYKPEDDPRDFTIQQIPEGWRLHGAAIERAAAMTYWELESSVRRFQRLMENLGVETALRKAGIQEGDTVFIGEDYELEWED